MFMGQLHYELAMTRNRFKRFQTHAPDSVPVERRGQDPLWPSCRLMRQIQEEFAAITVPNTVHTMAPSSARTFTPLKPDKTKSSRVERYGRFQHSEHRYLEQWDVQTSVSLAKIPVRSWELVAAVDTRTDWQKLHEKHKRLQKKLPSHLQTENVPPITSPSNMVHKRSGLKAAHACAIWKFARGDLASPRSVTSSTLDKGASSVP
ncbi:hypothetical protein PHMEG_00027764 [Phytophthora megakarya]|uniref:Uncharacterized protein n=1 Tax=Phytophthora megakarya TaxID=4795 RepID=A0A225V6H1_9STRA|nr:hypothetical protein PHMEG_00027764 [Phytophthora megakarya]